MEPNFPYTNDETGLDDFDQPISLEDEMLEEQDDGTDEAFEDFKAYWLEKSIDRKDSGTDGV